MTSFFVENEIKDLRELIIKADIAYDAGEQFKGDIEYDALYKQLVALEKDNPEFFDATSPTQKIYGSKSEGLEQVSYGDDIFLGSEDKVYTEDDIRKFASKSESAILAQFKEDGLTIYHEYLNGELSLASTRGLGEIGDVVTPVVRTVKNMPNSIPFKNRLEIRAEYVMPFKEFERINDELRASGVPDDKLYKSPRNLAAGTIRLLDTKVAGERNLMGIVFGLMSIEGVTFETDQEQLEFLREQGFTVVPTEIFENTPEGIGELVKFCAEFNDTVRGTLPNAIDGIVLKFNDLAVREELGYTTKFPRWSTAYKFTSLKAPTKILKIIATVGKLGQITPVAILKPVTLEVTIRRATLHNYFKLAERDIREGDTGVVERAGDVIPHIPEVIKADRTGDEVIVTAPAVCPECHAKTVYEGKILYCTGISCKPQLEGKLIHFVSKPAMNIDGLGEETIRTFIDQGFIKTFADIYRLPQLESEIVSLEGFGQKKFKKMVEGIEASKAAPLNKALYALSIRLIGDTATKAFAKNFKNIDEIIEVARDINGFRDKVRALKGFGEEMTNSLVSFFSGDVNIATLHELQALGLKMESEASVVKGDTFAGKVFVITGTLSKDRSVFKTLIESYKGSVVGTISPKIDYLLMGNGAEGTKKHKEALGKKVEIISEEVFNSML